MTGMNQPNTADSHDSDERQEAPSSAVLRAAGRVSAWVRDSRLYEWLTAEPEPEVIVIDLRETYTVGPFIRLLDTVVDRLQPHWEESTPKRLIDAAVRVGERVAETRVGGLALELLAPPEPPEQERGADGGDEPDETNDTTDGDDPSAPPRWRTAAERRDQK
jgi:hypothetical protein